MKKLFILVCAAFLTTAVSAQITWNMKAGFGFAHCYGADSWDLSPHFVGKIGAGIEKPLTSNWSLMPSLEVAMKGAKFWVEDNTSINLYYLQIPIVAAYRLSLADKWNLTFKAGPYLAYAFTGQSEDEEGSFNIFTEGYGKRFDLGLDFGIDFEYQRYVFGVEYELGFLNLVEGGSLKNGAFYVTVGYKF